MPTLRIYSYINEGLTSTTDKIPKTADFLTIVDTKFNIWESIE